MANKKIDLTGKIYGRLTIIERDNSGKYLWFCKCECGNTVSVVAYSLKRGATVSCGCYKKEVTSKRMTTHGQSYKNRTSEYNIWNLMVIRCHNLNDKNYGGRGVSVCERWLKFENFFADMGKRPTILHSLDRFPDNDGNYEFENCRWATKEEQDRNKRSNRWLEYNGERHILADWASKWSVSPAAIIQHFKRGKNFEQIFLFYFNKKIAA